MYGSVTRYGPQSAASAMGFKTSTYNGYSVSLRFLIYVRRAIFFPFPTKSSYRSSFLKIFIPTYTLSSFSKKKKDSIETILTYDPPSLSKKVPRPSAFLPKRSLSLVFSKKFPRSSTFLQKRFSRTLCTCFSKKKSPRPSAFSLKRSWRVVFPHSFEFLAKRSSSKKILNFYENDSPHFPQKISSSFRTFIEMILPPFFQKKKSSSSFHICTQNCVLPRAIMFPKFFPVASNSAGSFRGETRDTARCCTSTP